MAMGKRKRRAKQASMWVATQDLPRSAAHPFYARLNQILDQHDFDQFVEGLCERFYADEGRPGLPPGRYFRLLLIGYFEGLDAERAIAWGRPIRSRCASSSGWCCRRRRPIIQRFRVRGA
jgi:transposase